MILNIYLRPADWRGWHNEERLGIILADTEQAGCSALERRLGTRLGPLLGALVSQGHSLKLALGGALSEEAQSLEELIHLADGRMAPWPTATELSAAPEEHEFWQQLQRSKLLELVAECERATDSPQRRYRPIQLYLQLGDQNSLTRAAEELCLLEIWERLKPSVP